MKKLLALIMLCYGMNVRGDSWVQKASYVGGRQVPFCFTIGSKAYIGCGRNYPNTFHQDFWEFDPAINVWTQKANFGGGLRRLTIGLSIGNKGYAGLGESNIGVQTQDFWEYNPATNIWIQKANFGGGFRVYPVSFSVNNKGYIATGMDDSIVYRNDLWEFDPTLNLWTQKSNLPADGRWGASAFSIGIYGYIVGGYPNTGINGMLFNDLWQYDVITDSWTQKHSLPTSAARVDAAAFSICDKGYIGTGEGPALGSDFNDLWQYDPSLDLWTQKTNFGGVARDEGIGFSIGTKGYIGLGVDISSPFYSDFWEYTPDSECTVGITDIENNWSNFTLSPNPTKDQFTIIGLPINKNIEIKMTDANGKIVLVQQQVNATSNLTMPIANLPTGVYFVEVSEGENKAVRKLVVE